MSSHEEHHYHPKDAVAAGTQGLLVAGGAGLVTSAVQNALQKRNVGAFGVFTRTGGTIATFAAVGGVFEFASKASANLREKDDHYNTAIGGFLAGSILGLRRGRMPAILGWGAFTSVVLAAFDYTGGSFSGPKKDPEFDEFERKEKLRKNRRRALEETIADVGEGRSIRPPGYEERRRERLKEKYGLDISPVSADPDA